MKTATFVSEIKRNLVGAHQKLYKVDPPVVYDDGKKADYVVVSANCVLGVPETYIFPADKKGILDFLELDGSFRGALDHERALKDAGYEVKE